MLVDIELFHPVQKLGTFEMDVLPDVGELFELNGEQYRVRSRIFRLQSPTSRKLSSKRVLLTLMPWSVQ